ncbi:hypothetical protein COY95_00955 [Candidatus Woesearchaeota archaeon CG_4_10_14_0_8_um_filter_47_5]|nr:MAG: hypothetical protein COY95_00955 [Candidatus Woesearchaeota archaeon CG_4_10_14_0_8_um_filter_47_5]
MPYQESFNIMFSVANLLLTLFVISYILLFIMKVHPHKNRIPWEEMLVGFCLLFIVRILAVFDVFGLSLMWVEHILEILSMGIILMAFLTQYDIIRDKGIVKDIKFHQEKDPENSSESSKKA